MKRPYLLFVIMLGLALAACSSATPAPTTLPTVEPTMLPPTQPSATPTQISDAQPSQPTSNTAIQLQELTDSQGAVAVFVKPLDLGSQADKLTFEVALETHSVDLSMDLAELATLSTDTGYTVQADVWDAPRGGHHVSGTLSFPSSVDGKSILDGASKLTLIIKDLDAPERILSWELK